MEPGGPAGGMGGPGPEMLTEVLGALPPEIAQALMRMPPGEAMDLMLSLGIGAPGGGGGYGAAAVDPSVLPPQQMHGPMNDQEVLAARMARVGLVPGR